MTDSKTPRTENEARETSVDDLCKAALSHYDEVSAKACHWNNQIPQAIKFWYLEKPKLETENADLRRQVEEVKERVKEERALRFDYMRQTSKAEAKLAEAQAAGIVLQKRIEQLMADNAASKWIHKMNKWSFPNKKTDKFDKSGHVFQTHEGGDNVNLFAYEGGTCCNGPVCIVCGYAACWHCNPNPPKCPGAKK